MRNILLGALAGLILGTIGALAYSHFLGEGSLLADLQAKLDAANAALAKAETDKKEIAKENTGLSAQVDQLQASNADLKMADAAPAPAAAAQQPSADWGALAGVMRGMFRGRGFSNPQQRMLLFKTRLKLTSEQTTKIQAAMDADSKARRDLFQQAFQNGGKIDPAAAAKANTLDATLASVLNPDQQRAYAQLQTDEKTASADTVANSQVNSIMPLLQLSDTQKDQVYTAIYQQQLTAPDPNSLITNPNPMAALASQAQATTTALSKVLSSDQMSLYQQQNQANYGGQQRRAGNNNANGGNAGGANQGTTQNAGATTVSGYTSSSSSSLTTVTLPAPVSVPNPAPVTANSATTPDASTGNTATTNAASSTSTNAPPQ